MKLIVTAFMTLDGVVEAPGYDEHRDGKNAWALRIQGEEDEHYNTGQVFSADALLLGRKTFQTWAAFWPTAPPGPLADRVNEMPKYVVSTTLESVDWNNSTLISRDVAGEITRIKELPGDELVVYGSPDLVDFLVAQDLVDEYRLLIYPVILGSGKRLFRDGIDMHHLSLVATRTFDSGVILATYQPQQEGPTSRFETEFAWTQEQVRSFQAVGDSNRILATVLFTDLVDSTARAAEIGDRAWRRLIDRHDELARSEVARWTGRLVKATGDGVLATFDAPTRALRCAFDLRDALLRIGLEMRGAIHTGEIEQRDEDIGGIAVHIAARALDMANANEVVVTRTVRDLTTGTDLVFAPKGSVGLRGVPGQTDLFDASIS